MTGMSFHSLPSSASAEGWLTRVLGALTWLTLAALGAVFALSLLIWLVAMVVVSLVSSVFTGRPATVTLLWRRWRDMTRDISRPRWPQRSGNSTPRADTPSAAGGADSVAPVQDVSWRDVPAAGEAGPASR